MATIITKNSSTASSVPLAAQLVQGELAVNVTDKRLFTENSGGTVVELGTNPSSLSTGALAYTGTLTGGTGVVNLGSGQVYKDASGNVGIGTSSPAGLLDVSKATQGAFATFRAFGPAGQILWANGGASTSYLDSDTTIFRQSSASGNAERARIDSSGNLGIGTTSPVGKLNVKSTYASDTTTQTRFEDNTGCSLDFGGTASGAKWLNSRDTAAGTAVPMLFQTGGTERARIDSSGNLLVGTTSTSPVDVTASGVKIGGTGYVLNINQVSSAPVALARSTSTGSIIDFFYRSGTTSQVGSISTNGTSTAYNTSSDYRLKEAIAPMTGALARVAALRPCTYKWKVDGSDGQGFIAHELAEVEAGCVTGEKDAVDADGKPQYQGIDTSFLVATLAAAIQELKSIVDAQGAEIAALKSI